MTSPLDDRVALSLEKAGQWPLYSHQAEAVNHLAAGNNVMVATPAASGKSLCYQIPVIESILADSTSRALFLHPTKAPDTRPAQGNQEPHRRTGCESGGVRRGHTVRRARLCPQVGLTSFSAIPTCSISESCLTTGTGRVSSGGSSTWSWTRPMYTGGVFGSHLANLMRRLRRVCRIYGSSPQFILCSATIANPGELASELTGLDFEVVDDDGAPSGGRRFLFWNPPFIENTHSSRRSTNMEAATLFSHLVSKKVRTLTFVRTRRQAELVYLYAREQLEAAEKGFGRDDKPIPGNLSS